MGCGSDCARCPEDIHHNHGELEAASGGIVHRIGRGGRGGVDSDARTQSAAPPISHASTFAMVTRKPVGDPRNRIRGSHRGCHAMVGPAHAMGATASP